MGILATPKETLAIWTHAENFGSFENQYLPICLIMCSNYPALFDAI